MSGSAKVYKTLKISDLFEKMDEKKPKGFYTVAEISEMTGKSNTSVCSKMKSLETGGKIEVAIFKGANGRGTKCYKLEA